jgi:hypothetical protein
MRDGSTALRVMMGIARRPLASTFAKIKTFERAAGVRSINGLRCAEDMIENRPPARPVYSRDHASARTADQRERRAQARREAEALFAPKPVVTEDRLLPQRSWRAYCRLRRR